MNYRKNSINKLTDEFENFQSSVEYDLQKTLEDYIIKSDGDDDYYDESGSEVVGKLTREEILDEHYLKRIDEDFWDIPLGFIFDEKRNDLFIFVHKSDCLYEDPFFYNAFVDIWMTLDNVAEWNFGLVEVDDDFNFFETNILSWYMKERIELNENLTDKQKEQKILEFSEHIRKEMDKKNSFKAN